MKVKCIDAPNGGLILGAIYQVADLICDVYRPMYTLANNRLQWMTSRFSIVDLEGAQVRVRAKIDTTYMKVGQEFEVEKATSVTNELFRVKGVQGWLLQSNFEVISLLLSPPTQKSVVETTPTPQIIQPPIVEDKFDFDTYNTVMPGRHI